MTALFVAVALSALAFVLVTLAWGRLGAVGLEAPAIVAAVVASIAFVRAALTDPTDEARASTELGQRLLVGAGLGIWCFVSGLLALATTGHLSVLFTVIIGVLLFFGGIIPVLRWQRSREEAPPPATGKWR